MATYGSAVHPVVSPELMPDPAECVRILLPKAELGEAIGSGALRLIIAALFGFAPVLVCSPRRLSRTVCPSRNRSFHSEMPAKLFRRYSRTARGASGQRGPMDWRVLKMAAGDASQRETDCRATRQVSSPSILTAVFGWGIVTEPDSRKLRCGATASPYKHSTRCPGSTRIRQSL
jgi:hypothetical protein